MLHTRVIPILLLKNGGLVKGVQFKNHRYVGDPINAVKIFNEKEVDELIFLDISATIENAEPNYPLLKDIASEAFMPFGYGGGVHTLGQVEKLLNIGVEKVVINTAAFLNPKFITEASSVAGSQSIVVAIDVKKTWLGNYEVFVKNGTVRTRQDPVSYAKQMQALGAGELIINSIDNEGTGNGYDLKLIKAVSEAVEIPVVAAGGAGNRQDLVDAIKIGQASGVAAGNLFVFYGKHKAVLITYPSYKDLIQMFGGNK